ncbi:S-adenosyl-L-methionine-dependent methyltransferase [Daldinia loculata]|uniref:S-adenosyl-L-methionine-dependent methyltransferase n=1 Tax=Daldinia loculata TaxID=103429 RepID=UPI0020C376DD|nr:S-adenosyl-L-methionine-dependent methyltransferase [Daldinia loculata]KAI1648353.1 S-adenosyl-L-methionine-dependent methyltransferase [Daldinia loculata]
MPDYFVSSAEAENKRLEQASAVVRAYMDGNAFLAPIDTARGNLKVLDSATNNGFWLSQFQASLKDPNSATLIGTDLQDRFPDPPQSGISFQIQDINEPWPKSWKSTFDYVHQTLVLFQAGPKQREAINSLGELVKPGGWIELMEPQYEVTNDNKGPAYKQFLDMLGELWDMRGTKSGFAADLEGIVKDAGFVDVKSVLLPIGIGPKHKDQELAGVSVESTVGGGKNITIAGKSIPGGLKSISAEDFETWPARFEEELKTKGAYLPLRVVYGRKPEA